MANTPTNPKLYARVKSEAKKKFRVYPSAYANAYAVRVCKGDIKGPDGKRKTASNYSRSKPNRRKLRIG